MKTIFGIGTGLILSAVSVFGQQALSGNVTAKDSPFAIVQSGPHDRIWQATTYETAGDGTIIPHLHQYTEMASGLNYFHNGQWTESKEEIDILPDGTAAAIQGQHQAYFPADIYTGAIRLVTPDGVSLQSRPVGLSYDDGNNTVLFAELTNSVGYLASSNQVIFPDAFAGVSADLRYTFTRASFEQDVILRTQPPAPASLGLNPDTTRIQILTEFFNPPQPRVTATTDQTSAGALTDNQLDFGMMEMTRGRAFLLGETDPSVSVTKEWIQLGGRQLLVEEVPTAMMGAELEQLPLTIGGQASVNQPRRTIAKRWALPPQRLAKATPNIRLARIKKVETPTKGLVLDYVTLNTSLTNYVFQGDATYYVSGTLNLFGTNILEGGSVIKYAAGASISAPAPLSFKSGIYHPVVLTAKDDNTVGDLISGSTGSPSGYYANPALSVTGSGSQTVSNLKISYAQSAVASSAATLTVNNAQLVNCGSGITVQNHPLVVNNGLFVNLQTNLVLNAVAGTVNNATFYNANYLLGAPNTGTLYLTNSVLANVTNVSGTVTANYNGFYNTTTVGANTKSAASSPFIPVGGGRCYLTNSSTFIGGGTPAIGSSLLAQLAVRTTRAPVIYSNLSYTVPLSYGNVATRDNSGTPDLGYHYDPLDVVFGGVISYSNITFSAGTAMGWFELSSGGNYGLLIYDNSVVSFNGTASQPCTVVRYSSVQEGGTGTWQTKGFYAAITAGSLSGGYSMPPANAAQVWPNFTKHYSLSFDPSAYRENTALIKVNANNSEFYTGPVGAYWAYLNITNCLFDRSQLNVVGGNAAQAAIRNTSFHGGSVSFTKGSAWPVWFEECGFDGTALAVGGSVTDSTNVTYCDFNAYLSSTTNHLPVMGAHSISITNFNWQTSFLGSFYPNCPQLTDAGSQSAANYGLYHFTTSTSQTIEANTIVDIGYHYVATDANGNPLDTNGDGIPDYLEDANGNGLFDAGDLGEWQISPYGLGGNNQLQVFTPLK